jgi:hypothetical protein
MRDPLFASRDYRLLLIIGLLWGSSSSQLTMLAAIFRAHGFETGPSPRPSACSLLD